MGNDGGLTAAVRLRGLVALTEFSLSAASRWFSFGIIPRTMRTDCDLAKEGLVGQRTRYEHDANKYGQQARA